MKQGKLYKLGDICDFQGGSQPPKQEWIRTPKEGYVRMLQIRDFTQSREFIIEYVKCSKKLRYCNEDDILIGRYGASVGKILTGLGGAYNVAIIKTIPNEQIITKAYIRRFFEGDVFQALLQKVCGQRTAQAGFSKEDIVDCPIFVPSLSEQQRIVALLDAEFAKIDALKANAEKNLQNAKDLFQAALKKELEPKEGWIATAISNVSKSSENIKWKNVNVSEKFKYIDLTSVDRSSHSIIDPQIITSQNAPSRAQRIVKTNDVIFATTRPTLKRLCIIPKEYDGNICSTGFCVIRPHLSVLPKWIYYNLSTEEFYDYVEPLQTGATYPAITDNDIRNYIIYLPSIEDQQSIVSRLDTLNEKCKALQTNYEKTLSLCDDLKQALLKKAFDGEL